MSSAALRPEQCGRAMLSFKQGHECRRIGIDDHWRCSVTRSLTVPAASTGCGAGRLRAPGA